MGGSQLFPYSSETNDFSASQITEDPINFNTGQILSKRFTSGKRLILSPRARGKSSAMSRQFTACRCPGSLKWQYFPLQSVQRCWLSGLDFYWDSTFTANQPLSRVGCHQRFSLKEEQVHGGWLWLQEQICGDENTSGPPSLPSWVRLGLLHPHSAWVSWLAIWYFPKDGTVLSL